MSRVLAVLLAGTISACAPVRASHTPGPTPQASPSQSIVLAPGEAGHADGTPLTITFDAVVDDSRCPEDVDCIWAGDVSVKVRLTSGQAAPHEATLHLNTSPRETSHAGHRVTLVAVTPHPKASAKIEPREYRATLRVEAQ